VFTRPQVNPRLPSLMRLLAFGLVLLVLMLTFATVSPVFHQALHVDAESHPCEGHSHQVPSDSDVDHSCAVTLFDRGGMTVMLVVELPQRADLLLGVVSQVTETNWIGQAPIRLCSRAPPIEGLV